jgi:hypothetical protein
VNLYFITHPNVVVSRDIPVPRWPLSELGRERMRARLKQPWLREVTSTYCSTEQKAIDGATILAEHLALDFKEVEDLGENDRSATGFLPPDEFERVADEFFRSPEKSVRGWERAIDAQSCVVRADERIAKRTAPAAPSLSCPMERWARCSTAIWPDSRSPGARTSRRMAAATTTGSLLRRSRRTPGGARSMTSEIVQPLTW